MRQEFQATTRRVTDARARAGKAPATLLLSISAFIAQSSLRHSLINRVQKYYPIGLDLSEKDFGRIQNSSVRKELRLLKNKITNWDKKVKDIIHQLDPFTFDDFKEKLFEKKIESPDLYGLFDVTIEDLTIQ